MSKNKNYSRFLTGNNTTHKTVGPHLKYWNKTTTTVLNATKNSVSNQTIFHKLMQTEALPQWQSTVL